MPTHLGGEPHEQSSCEDELVRLDTDRKTSLLRDRPARRAVKRAYRIWVSDAAHHCVQRRVDLLFTMSNNLHRDDRNQRDTNSGTWTSNERRGFRVRRRCRSTVAPLQNLSLKAWWSQTGSNRRPPACKAGALPTELWPRLPEREGGGPGKTRTSDLTLIKRAL